MSSQSTWFSANGKLYFFNPSTGERSWTNPLEDNEEDTQLLPSVQETITTSTEEKWFQAVTPGDRVYFFNSKTKETRWNNPYDDLNGSPANPGDPLPSPTSSTPSSAAPSPPPELPKMMDTPWGDKIVLLKPADPFKAELVKKVPKGMPVRKTKQPESTDFRSVLKSSNEPEETNPVVAAKNALRKMSSAPVVE